MLQLQRQARESANAALAECAEQVDARGGGRRPTSGPVPSAQTTGGHEGGQPESARHEDWHSSMSVHERIIASKRAQGWARPAGGETDKAKAGKDAKHRRQTNSLSPPRRACPSRAWPPLFISLSSRSPSLGRSDKDNRDRANEQAAERRVGSDDPDGQGRERPLDYLNIMSVALDELGTVVLRAAVAEQVRDEQHKSERKEQESKLRLLRHACRQLQHEARASRQARTELASQVFFFF